MKPSGGGRSDFVLGMSLAELFLLLLFCFFLVTTAKVGGAQDPSVAMAAMKERMDALNRRVAELELQLETVTDELGAKMALIEQLRRMVGAGAAADEALPAKIEELLRPGVPDCAESNVILAVRAIRGVLEVEVVGLGGGISAHLRKSAFSLEVGSILTQRNDIDRLLRAVWAYEDQHRCRYDYRLQWATPEDYLARELFERYLYPDEIRRIVP